MIAAEVFFWQDLDQCQLRQYKFALSPQKNQQIDPRSRIPIQNADPGWSKGWLSRGDQPIKQIDPRSRIQDLRWFKCTPSQRMTNQLNRKTNRLMQDPGSRIQDDLSAHQARGWLCWSVQPTPCSFSPIFPPYCLTLPLHRPYVIKCRLYCPNPFETFRYGAVCVSKPSEYFPKPFERTKPSDMWQFACENLQSTSLTPSKKQNLQIWGFFCMSEPFVDFLQIWHSIHPIGILKIQNWS